MRDFTSMRRHVLFYFTLKFSFWTQLPYCLFAIAHHDRAKAVQAARRAIALAANRIGNHEHWLVVSLCVPGSILYAQLVQFIQGTDLLLLQSLATVCAKFKFAPVCERWVEGRHAIIKKQMPGGHAARIQHLV